MKIHLYYRHYNVSGNDNRGRPEWFDFEKCYLSLLNSLNDNCWINIIYDGDSINDNWISKHYSDLDYNINAGSDKSSFFQTMDIIKNDSNIKDEDLIYILENDYLHIKGWVEKVFNLFQTYKGIGYVSLYDHNDKYFLPQYLNLTSKIITTKDHHWRSTPSTCGSFIISKKLFDEDYDILSTMEGDHNKFLWLNKHRERTVLTPIPGLSSHIMEGLMSPTIDWKNKLL